MRWGSDAPGGVNRLLERACAAGLVPGAVAAWSRAGESSEAAVGRASLRPQPRPATPESVYDLASLTKPIATTTLLLLARREGRIDLDWPVVRLLPEARGQRTAELPVGALATHTAGLPAWKPVYAMATEQGTDAVRTLVGIAPEQAPGEDVVYSCLGFLLLGMMLERAFDEPFDVLFRERVAQPCGCAAEIGYRRTPFGGPTAGGAAEPTVERDLVAAAGGEPRLVPPLAAGYPDDGNARWLDGVAGNAGLFGTARGVLAVARQYLQAGGTDELLTPAEVALAVRNHTPGRSQARGLGWQLAATPGCSAGPDLNPTAFGHTGFTGTSLWIDPARAAILVLLSNRNHPAHRGVDLRPLRRRFHSIAVAASIT